MAKKFDIHKWQAEQNLKQYLAEADDFTPDLEDDDLKRSKIQQMMAKEKESEYELTDEEKDSLTDMTNEFVRKLTDIRGGNYSGDKLLAALQFVILNIQDMEPMLYTDTDGDGTPDVVDNDEEELNEVEIKKVVDQSMSNDDIGKLMDVIRNNDLGKTLNTIAVIVDQTGGMPEGAAQKIADIVPGIVPDEDKPDSDKEIEEMNMTGTGSSVNAGGGEGIATPNAFAKKGKWKGKKATWKEQEEPSTEEPSLSLGDAVDTNKELGDQLKKFGSQLKTPDGAKGFDKSEIEMLSQLLIAVSDSIQTGNATTLLKRMLNLI